MAGPGPAAVFCCRLVWVGVAGAVPAQPGQGRTAETTPGQPWFWGWPGRTHRPAWAAVLPGRAPAWFHKKRCSLHP